MPIIIKARCHILQPNNRIVRAQFDVVPGGELWGEYILTNLLIDRGLLQDGRVYRITISPYFPHIVGEENL